MVLKPRGDQDLHSIEACLLALMSMYLNDRFVDSVEAMNYKYVEGTIPVRVPCRTSTIILCSTVLQNVRTVRSVVLYITVVATPVPSE